MMGTEDGTLPDAAKRLARRGGMWLEFGCYKGSSLALMAKAAAIRPASRRRLSDSTRFGVSRSVDTDGGEGARPRRRPSINHSTASAIDRPSHTRMVHETLEPYPHRCERIRQQTFYFPHPFHIDYVYTSTRDVLTLNPSARSTRGPSVSTSSLTILGLRHMNGKHGGNLLRNSAFRFAFSSWRLGQKERRSSRRNLRTTRRECAISLQQLPLLWKIWVNPICMTLKFQSARKKQSTQTRRTNIYLRR